MSVLNRERAERLLAEAGVDAVVASTYENVFYLSGFVGFNQRVMPTTQVYAVARTEALGDAVLVAPISDMDMQAQFPAELAAIRPYGRFFVEPSVNGGLDGEQARYDALAHRDPEPDAVGALLDELASLPPSARVAVDERGMAPAARAAVLDHLGGRAVPGSDVLAAIRMVKTEEEVRRLETAAIVTEQSYLAAIEAAYEGMTEAEMARRFDCRTIEQGGRPHFTVLAFGERGAFPNAVPSEARRLARGDAIRFDIGCRVDMYSSDIARTAVFGEPSQKVIDYYAALLAGEELMLELVRPGITAGEVFDAAVERVRETGIPRYRRQHVGHGVGLDTYDPPVLGPGVETPLEAGMVFEIETPYYELGFAGLQVEDTIVVTDDGCRLLTRTSRELVRLG